MTSLVSETRCPQPTPGCREPGHQGAWTPQPGPQSPARCCTAWWVGRRCPSPGIQAFWVLGAPLSGGGGPRGQAELVDAVRGLRSVDVPEPALGTVQLGCALHDLWEKRALDFRGPHAPRSTGPGAVESGSCEIRPSSPLSEPACAPDPALSCRGPGWLAFKMTHQRACEGGT